MKLRKFVLFIGPAGSGKSTTLYAYAKWLQETLGYCSCKINLDPAVEYIPYEPDYDIRSIVDANKIAKECGLGPNGALVKSMDVIAERINEILQIVSNMQDSYSFMLIDTPGQIEIFLFRDIAYRLVNGLRRVPGHIVAVFVGDAETIKRYEDFAFLTIISVALQIKLGIDVVPIINKIDTRSVDELIGDAISDLEIVRNRLRNLGVYGEMLENILSIVALYSKATQIPKISAKYFIGIDELHRIMHEVTCACGDLT